MVGGHRSPHDQGLFFRRQASQPHQNNTGGNLPHPENQLSKIAIGRQQDGPFTVGQVEDSLVGQAGSQFGHIQHTMPCLPEALDDRSIQTLVGQEVQRVFSVRG